MIDKKDLFIKKIQTMFGARHARILQHLYVKPPVTFRVNTNKISASEVLKKLKMQKFMIKPGPLANSFVVERTPEGATLSSTDLFIEGKIYIQGLSSMVPAIMLDPQEGERILDLCAAPGSKTTQISALTKGKAQIIAVDNNRNRIYKLENTIEIQGANAEVIYSSGVGLENRYKIFIEYFDRILLDAPCSNEGRIFINDPATYEHWNPKLPKKISKLQKKLVSSAINMLKPGGVLVYSTCTFSREENEQIVVWLLARYKNMSLIEIKKILPDGYFTGFFAAKFVKIQ